MLDSLPEVFASELSQPAIRSIGDALLRVDVVSVRVKPHAHPLPLEHGYDLSSALSKLYAGDVRGVVVRYHAGGDEWLDTLEATPHGGRLVRLKLPRLQAVEPSGA